jgi:predicted RNase H-like HicB family nuclease
MQSVRFVCWQGDDAWLGYLESWPEYLTQGDSLADLFAHLKDLHQDFTTGAIQSGQ